MDITSFMSWFLDQFINLLKWFFDILDHITFFGISLLDFSIAVVIIGVIIPVLLTIASNSSVLAEKSDQIKESRLNKERNKKNDPEGGRWV